MHIRMFIGIMFQSGPTDIVQGPLLLTLNERSTAFFRSFLLVLNILSWAFLCFHSNENLEMRKLFEFRDEVHAARVER